MHPNPIFRKTPTERNIAFARERAFGTLSVNGVNGPLSAHVPFLLGIEGQSAELHLVRSNPIARADLPMPAVLSVSGGDAYISPDWYGVPDQVPTWNYVAVELRGVLKPLPQEALSDLLDRQSLLMEEQLLPKQPWQTCKMTPEIFERMMRQIQPFVLEIKAVEGTWKLGQNKPSEVRLRAAQSVNAYPMGLEARIISALMEAVEAS